MFFALEKRPDKVGSLRSGQGDALFTILSYYMRLPLFFCFGALALLLGCHSGKPLTVRPADGFQVIAYYAGNGQDLDTYRWEQLTQVIYSFCHLRGNQLAVDDAADSVTIRRLVALKRTHPHLKVLLSLGGWCGCKTCSDVFATTAGRQAFAASTMALLRQYGADGLDLDWEYPGIEGCPDHAWQPADRMHFTELVRALRLAFGRRYELSFAAGGFQSFFDHSVDWAAVMPLIERVNLMSYDLVSGFSTRTGHHTALYATPQQTASVDHGVQYLAKLGVPRRKIVIGAAFYGRTWVEVSPDNNGLYHTGKFKSFVGYRNFDSYLSAAKGFVFYRDSVAQAPYAYSAQLGEFATFDDPISLAAKTRYARAQGLGGIMFWQLTSDAPSGTLLRAIFEAKQ